MAEELAYRNELPEVVPGVPELPATATLTEAVTAYNTLLAAFRAARLMHDEANPAPTIWVHGTVGDDTRDGSRFYPIRTTTQARLLAEALYAQAGIPSVVGLSRGSVFRSQVRLNPPGSTVVGHGPTLDPPLVAGDDQVVNTAFRATATPNVYEFDVVLPMPSTGTQLDADPRVTLYRSGALLRRVASVAALAADGDYHAPTINAATGAGTTIVLSVYSTTDPRTVATGTYEVGRREYGVLVADGGSVVGVHARRSIAGGGPIKAGLETTMRNCLSSDGVKHNFFQSSGRATDCIGWLHEGDAGAGSATIYVAYAIDPRGRVMVYERCFARGGPYIAGVTGFYGHGAVLANRYARVEHLGVVVDDCQNAITTLADTLVVGRCSRGVPTYVRATTSAGVNQPSTLAVQVDGYTVHLSSSPSGRTAAVTAQFGAATTLSLRNLSVYASRTITGGALWLVGTAPPTVDRSIILSHTQSTGAAVYSRTAASPPRLTGCVVWGQTNCVDVTSYSNLSNYNVFRSANGALANRFRCALNGVSYDSLSAWQAATGADSQSVRLTDAQAATFFLGDPATGDFRINPNAQVTAANGTVYTGTFPDGTPLASKIGLEYVQAAWPVVPNSLADAIRYVRAPGAWAF